MQEKLKGFIIKNRVIWLYLGLNLLIVAVAASAVSSKMPELQQALGAVVFVSWIISVPSLTLYVYALTKG